MRLTTFATFGLALGLLIGGCASSKTKPDESKTAESSDEAAEEGAEGDEKALEFRAKAPAAKKIGEEDGVKAYRIGKLTVLHKPTPANEVVSAKLYIDGGVANLDEKTAGIENLALRTAVNGGTESTPKDEFTSTLNSMGSSVSAFTERDYSGYTLRSIVKHFDKSWELFIEAMLEPAMPKDELTTQRKKQLAEIDQISENPNRLVSVLARKQIAKSHPYRHLQLGTRENVESFEREQVLAYQRELLNPARMLLVVVGDIPTKKVIKKARASLGRLVAEEWERPKLPKLESPKTELAGEKKGIPTNYILGLFPAPEPEAKDYPAMKLALAYLSDRLFEEVRTKRNLSYAVASGLSTHRANSGYLYVSAKQPNKTLKVMFDEVDKLKQEKLNKKQLQRTRNVFITEHYMGLETNSNQASSLARAELIEGDWKKHAEFLDEIKSVTPAQVKKAANAYMKTYQFGVVGSPDKVKPASVSK